MKWFRLYSEILDDPKINKMSPKKFKFFIFLLCLASEQEHNGVINLTEKEISWRVRMPLKTVASCLAELKELKIITANPPISFINWGKRQFKSDKSTDRVKKHRDSKGNVTETFQ